MKTKPQENKSVKTLKGQLFGAVAMMLVAAIALGTSTYAWFINNQTVEVENMQLTVSTSTSLLVQVEKQAAPDTWTGSKSVVTNNDITVDGGAVDGAGWTEFLSTEMVPASTTEDSLKTASGGAKFFMTDNHVLNGRLDQFLEVPAARDETGVGQGPVKHLGLKFLASNNTDVYFGAKELTALANLITARTQGNPASGMASRADQSTAIKRALRVGIYPAGASAPIVLQFDAGTVIDSNGNNTDYNSKEGGLTQDETTGKYIGIASVDNINTAPVGNKIASTGVLTAYLPTASTTKYMATVDTDGKITRPSDAGQAPLFTVPAGADGLRVDVYIWLDGTDHDCLNELSGYSYNLRLPFVGVPTTPAP